MVLGRGDIMARQRKRADGRLCKTFTFKGKRYYIYGYSKQEVEEKEYAKRKELEKGQERRDNPTMNEYYEAWTENRRGSIKEATLHGQICQFKVCSKVKIGNASRSFGELKIKEVTVEDIRQVQKALLKEGRKTRTTNDAISHLSHVFKTAMEERLIDYNPCKIVKPLKRTEECARDTHHRALTVEETKAFFAEAKDSYYFDVYRFAINTGMRCGEIGALYNTDIKDNMINVERTITRLENGSYIIGESAKTENGRRKIPVNDAIKEIIQHQKNLNKILHNSDIVQIKDRIFKACEGGLLMATPADRDIKRICKRIGMQYFTMHAFRATFATRLIEQGINPRTVQELLGHADFRITMNLYGHVLDNTKRDAMESVRIAL